ncbi:hypothetical protein B0A50_04212 [Salinomyces thailandicus]|uniref:Uncharacterized protein n=1 Tax=Salinomyces thailandicus TaxID=706561 RepID=A0A4U0U047_9PEZI|nr:hypothetical protein B0A50_04212 [Salinomyces thailandica]
MRIDAAVVAAVVLLVATGKAQVSSRPESSAALTSSVSSSDESSRVPNTNISTVAGPGDPNIAAMFDGSYRGPLLPALVPTPAREYRRQAAASSSTVNYAAATVPVCPAYNGSLYADDNGANYIVNCGYSNTGSNEIRKGLQEASTHRESP